MTKSISLRIDDDLLREIDRAGATDSRARSEVVREALDLWLKNRRVQAQVQRHRDGYARHPVGPDEFAPVLGAQKWPR